jgi:nitrogen fixation protein FixH
MNQLTKEKLTYIGAIIAVNVVFLYLRTTTDPGERKLITGMHVFFGVVQAVYLLPKIFRNKM